MVDCASRMTVLSPALARVMAAARPLGPEPTTTASGVMGRNYIKDGGGRTEGRLASNSDRDDIGTELRSPLLRPGSCALRPRLGTSRGSTCLWPSCGL